LKIAIVYHSQSGNTEKVAESICKVIESFDSITLKKMSLKNLDSAFLESANAIIVGSPTYCGSYSWEVKQWFDTTPLNLSGKIGSVFITEDYLGGGADVAALGIAGMMLIRGMLVYSAGFTMGKPFTHYGAITIKAGDDEQIHRAQVLGKRLAEKTLEIFN